MSVNDICKSFLQRPCMYTLPPLKYINGHSFCPCITEALRQDYIGGYIHGRDGVEPEVGTESVKSSSNRVDSIDTTGTPTPDGEQDSSDSGKSVSGDH